MTLRLPLAEDPQVPEHLVGLLAYQDEGGKYRGLKVDVPFTSQQSAIAQVGAVGAGDSAGAEGYCERSHKIAFDRRAVAGISRWADPEPHALRVSGAGHQGRRLHQSGGQ